MHIDSPWTTSINGKVTSMPSEETLDIEKVKLHVLDETHRVKNNPSRAYTDFIKTHTNLPVLVGIPITQDSVGFVCPWCNALHTHSAISGKRASHCPKHPEDYYIFNVADIRK